MSINFSRKLRYRPNTESQSNLVSTEIFKTKPPLSKTESEPTGYTEREVHFGPPVDLMYARLEPPRPSELAVHVIVRRNLHSGDVILNRAYVIVRRRHDVIILGDRRSWGWGWWFLDPYDDVGSIMVCGDVTDGLEVTPFLAGPGRKREFDREVGIRA